LPWAFGPDPMLGHCLVEPGLEPPGLELPGLELPGLELPELELPELEPVLGVVAAAATRAPPATRPEVSAPVARTVRRRNRMGWTPFVFRDAPSRSDGAAQPVPQR
jgi:hypothetical protein